MKSAGADSSDRWVGAGGLKIHKRQFAIPITLQSNPAVTWRHVNGSIVRIAAAHS